jgi:hypothetical protein
MLLLGCNLNKASMNIQQKQFSVAKGWETLRNDGPPGPPEHQLVFAFGAEELLLDPSLHKFIRESYPSAQVLMNTTSGEISGTRVSEDSISLTALHLQSSYIHTAAVNLLQQKNSYFAGALLAGMFDPVGLKYVMVISDGQKVNGSELVKGLQSHLPPDTLISGGLAGDGVRFSRTLVGLNESPVEGRVIAVGFYGNIEVRCGSRGGWTPFGPERLITRSEGNVLYELDGMPALDVYKLYLGDYSLELPVSGLFFPLSIKTDTEANLVRTILSVSEKENSLTFAGNMPEGSYTRFMMANVDKLVEGAAHAAQCANEELAGPPDLAILISCVGRKLVLNQRVEEEIEIVKAVYGDKTAITGFYSYGEISPSRLRARSELHNQTMTITTFTEKQYV